MDIQKILRYLNNDLQELNEIVNDFKSGQVLSNVELKLLKNRIRNLGEELDVLNESLQVSETEEKVESVPAEEKPKLREEKKEEQIKHVEDEKQQVVEENEEKQEAESIIEEETEVVIDGTVDEEDAEPEEEVITETTEEQVAEEEEEDVDKLINSAPRKTIADAYHKPGGSLNERMSQMIEQKDLASRLADNPIESLRKGIKINDKLRFIKELFGSKADVYNKVVADLDQKDDLDSALHYLETNCDFNQQNESFKAFIELVYRRFIQ